MYEHIIIYTRLYMLIYVHVSVDLPTDFSDCCLL